MLKVDLSNVWGDLSLPDLLATEQEVFAAHKTLAEGRGPGNDFLGWLELPTFEETEELQRIRRAAERIRADSDVFVVVGIGGSYLGPRAAIELVKGQNHNLKDSDPQVFFAGSNAVFHLCQTIFYLALFALDLLLLLPIRLSFRLSGNRFCITTLCVLYCFFLCHTLCFLLDEIIIITQIYAELMVFKF